MRQGVPENKGREAKVRGICMAKRRRGHRTSFTLLNHIPGGGPVERSFPLYASLSYQCSAPALVIAPHPQARVLFKETSKCDDM